MIHVDFLQLIVLNFGYQHNLVIILDLVLAIQPFITILVIILTTMGTFSVRDSWMFQWEDLSSHENSVGGDSPLD